MSLIKPNNESLKDYLEYIEQTYGDLIKEIYNELIDSKKVEYLCEFSYNFTNEGTEENIDDYQKETENLLMTLQLYFEYHGYCTDIDYVDSPYKYRFSVRYTYWK